MVGNDAPHGLKIAEFSIAPAKCDLVSNSGNGVIGKLHIGAPACGGRQTRHALKGGSGELARKISRDGALHAGLL